MPRRSRGRLLPLVSLTSVCAPYLAQEAHFVFGLVDLLGLRVGHVFRVGVRAGSKAFDDRRSGWRFAQRWIVSVQPEWVSLRVDERAGSHFRAHSVR